MVTTTLMLVTFGAFLIVNYIYNNYWNKVETADMLDLIADSGFFLYQEDSDLSRRVLEEKLGSIVYHPDMQVVHQWARENTRTFKGRMRQMVSVFKYFLKWGITW